MFAFGSATACQTRNTGNIGRGGDTIPVTISCTPGSNCPPTACGNGNCDIGESCSTCPQDCNDAAGRACRRVGMIYSVWHQPAAYAAALAAQQNVKLLSVEDVLRSRQENHNAATSGYGLGDVYGNAAVAQAGGNYYYQYQPRDGYYCIYHRRDAAALNYNAQTDTSAPYDCPDYQAQLRKHAEALVAAGVDFVVVDMTHSAEYTAAWDIAQLRPFEVLVQEWSRLRATGIATPDIAAWQALPLAGQEGLGNPNMASLVLNIYNAPQYDTMFVRDAATHKKVFFYPTGNTPDANAVTAVEQNSGSNNLLAQPMWVSQQADGAWSFFAACQTPVMFDDAPCAQIPTFNSKIGSQLAVAPSYQTGYASVPFEATGVYGGVTLRKQFAQALAQQPDYVLLGFWNEQIAQPFNTSQAPSMGLENDPTASQAAFVGLYGVEFSHDIEPSVEYGSLLYDIVQSCVALYRSGATRCADANAACCRGGDFNATYTFYQGAQGTFGLYVGNPDNNRLVLNLCVSGSSDYFLSTSTTCENEQMSRALGFIGKSKGGETLRALRRCFSQATGHQYSLSGACPSALTEDAILGYVR